MTDEREESPTKRKAKELAAGEAGGAAGAGTGEGSGPAVETETRRSFLAAGVGLLTGLITAALGLPLIVSAIARAAKARSGKFSKVAELASLPLGRPVDLKYMAMTEEAFVRAEEMRDVWALRTSASEVTVFSPICPHLGCRYHWDDGAGKFVCPCHGSLFAKDGKVLAGPAPRSLDTLPVKIEGGAVMVEWELFEVGTAEKTVMER